MSSAELVRQHLIDPEICIRCNTCEDTCPIDAVTHDDTNYVVKPNLCDLCMDCIAPCPTGAIDNWRMVRQDATYSLEEQYSWDELPPDLDPASLESGESKQPDYGDQGVTTGEPVASSISSVTPGQVSPQPAESYNALLPPWSAAHPYANLYGPGREQKSVVATVTGNVRVTEIGTQYDTHHIVLDFGEMPFPVLEGQSVGILPPGVDERGRPHHARQYSVASPRNGERPGYNNVSLTIKRVLENYDGNPVYGVASNYMCDLKVGERVEVIGPFGNSFLMPNHPASNIVMICTGTGSAPMRAMTEWRRRLRKSGKFTGGRLLLFFGARSQKELPYFGPLRNLPEDFIDINFAFSRMPDRQKMYVQDVMRQRSRDLAELLVDPDSFFYVCGLKAMETGVTDALRDICVENNLDWQSIGQNLKSRGRLHIETY